VKPILILPPGAMSAEDIKLLRDNELCVVVSKDPAKVKFLDPIPSAAQRSKIETAAIRLSRILLNRQWAHITNSSQIDFGVISRLYIECLIEGTPLDKAGTLEEQEQRIFDQEKRYELERLAREEARAERKAAKEAKAKAEAEFKAKAKPA
jgi:hypothetical protein